MAREAACRRLRELLFGEDYLNAIGFIGMGTNEIIVFVQSSKRQWRGPHPMEWEGYPVQWRYGVGPIVAGLFP